MRVTHAATEPTVGESEWIADHVIDEAHTHNYAAPGHNHDASYAPTHDHPYADDDHTHDTSHNHDGSYAVPHSHPYSADDHAHSEYATDSDLSTHAATAHGLSAHAIDGAFHTGTTVLPSAGQKNALAGTTGTPGDANRYVTDSDARLSDARAPTAHSHVDAEIPAAIARDSEVTAAIATHAATPHGGSTELYAVGDIFITTRSGNPSTLLGYGTWAVFGDGRLLMSGATAEQTSGSSTHNHAAHSDHAALTHFGTAVGNHAVTQPAAHTDHTQILNHTHVITASNTAGTSGTSATRGSGTQATVTAPNPSGGVAAITHSAHTGTAVDAHSVTQPAQHATQSHSAHDAVSHLPPVITVNVWKRTA